MGKKISNPFSVEEACQTAFAYPFARPLLAPESRESKFRVIIYFVLLLGLILCPEQSQTKCNLLRGKTTTTTTETMNNNDENEEEFAAGSNAVGSEPITDEYHQQAGDTTLSSSKYDFDNGMLLDLCNDQLILLFLSFS